LFQVIWMGTAFFLLALLALPGRASAALPWPQFRGPDGQGHAGSASIPVTFGETENLAWKTPLPGQGWSSPVSDSRLLWMTTALDASNPHGDGQTPREESACPGRRCENRPDPA